MKRVVAVSALVALVLAFASTALAGERQEIVSKRTEFAKVFDNGDGTYTAEVQNYPVHKKSVRGDWVEIADIERGVGKAAVNVSNYNVYTVSRWYGSQYHWVRSGDYGFTSPSDLWSVGIPPTIFAQYVTAYLFYLAGIDAQNTTAAYYVINNPSSAYDRSFSVTKLSSNPRWADSTTVFNECYNGTSLATCWFNSSNPISVMYSSMATDVSNAASSGFISYGHREIYDGSSHAEVELLGSSATLYLTITPPAKKIVQFSQAVSVSPNPFNPATTLNFSVAKAGQVELTVYNQNGQKVASLVNGHLSPGKHSVSFHGEQLGSGIYFYQLRSGGELYKGKMLLVK